MPGERVAPEIFRCSSGCAGLYVRRWSASRSRLPGRRRAGNLQRAHDALKSLVEQRTLAFRRLSVKLLRVQDEERRRIARELHASLGQDLTASKN